MNYERDLFKNLKMNAKLSYSNSKNNMILQSQGSGDLGSNAILGVITFNPLRDVEAIIEEEEGGANVMGSNFSGNPYLVVNRVTDILTQDNLIGNLSLKYNLDKYLQLQVNGGMNQSYNVRDAYHPRGTGQGTVNQGLAFKGMTNRTNLMMDLLLNYNRNFGKAHRINAVAGHTYQTWFGNNLTAKASYFMDDSMGNTNMSWALASERPNSFSSKWALESYLARINYTLLDRYIFTVTGRSDGSTRLSPKNKWSFFPSAALAWRINQEPFLKNIEQISNLKLKLSYGVSGNQNIGVGATQSTMGIEYYPVYGNVTNGIVPSSMANDNLGWETTAQYNAGLETGFFNNRLRFNVDLYTKTTSNLLFNLPAPPTSGYSTYPVNMGSIENKGIDVDVSADIFTGKLGWTLSGNFSINRNKVLDMGGMSEFTGKTYISTGDFPLNQPVHIIRVGEPVGALYGYVVNGVYQNAEEVAAGPESATAKPGDLKYADISGVAGVPDGVVDANDRTIIGNPYPKFNFGVTNTVTFKGFTLNVFIQSSIGAQVANLNRYVLDGLAGASYNVSRSYYEGAWRGEGTSNYYPTIRAAGVANYNLGRFSSYLVDDASYIRLKNVSLSYNFNMKKLKFINRLQVFVSGSNLVTLTNYKGYDPEVSSDAGSAMSPSVDFGTYPVTRTFSTGLNLTF
jgi:TonB-linked SusC/RagA family outer membrane protein